MLQSIMRINTDLQVFTLYVRGKLKEFLPILFVYDLRKSKISE